MFLLLSHHSWKFPTLNIIALKGPRNDTWYVALLIGPIHRPLLPNSKIHYIDRLLETYTVSLAREPTPCRTELRKSFLGHC